MVGRARIKASNHIAIKQRYLLQVVSLTLAKGKAMTMSRSTARTRIVKSDARNAAWLIKYPACISVGLSGNQWRSPNRSSPGKPMIKSHTARFKMKAAVLQSSLNGSLQLLIDKARRRLPPLERILPLRRKENNEDVASVLSWPFTTMHEKKRTNFSFQQLCQLGWQRTNAVCEVEASIPTGPLDKSHYTIEQAKQRGPRKIRVVSLYFVIGWLCKRPFKSVVTWLLIGGLNCTVTELIVPLLTLVHWVVKTFYFLNCWENKPAIDQDHCNQSS